jgi:DNA-binding SARP family transcriptional activator
MDITLLLSLKPFYQSLLEQHKMEEYIAALCHEGLAWWFNMEIPHLALHLAPLSSLPPQVSLPARLLFLSEAVKGSIPIDSMDRFYLSFLDQNDLEAASAVAGAGAASIWDSGSDFTRFDKWYERISYLLDRGDRLSPLSQASLLGFRGMMEISYLGDFSRAWKTFESQLSWADKAGSSSLKVFRASALGYCLVHTGELSKLELVFFDAAPLCHLPETSLICRVYFQIALGLFYLIQGKIAQAKALLQETVTHPFFEMLPPSIWLLGCGNLLLTAAFAGDADEVEAISRKIHGRAIPEQNHFHQAYVHYNMGVAFLVLGKPYKALLYSREAVERSRKSKSPIHERTSALLMGQALSDLGRDREAMEHLSGWLKKWRAAGLNNLVAAGALEISCLLLKSGKLNEARDYFGKATAGLPRGEQLPALYRPPEFLEKLRKSLSPDSAETRRWAGLEDAPVRIQTFGELCVRIGDRTLYDRKWKGGRTKALLKALIVHGGTKISADLLVDTLWPDADGDMASGSLKVAISRLRRIGGEAGKEPLPWIMVQHGHISLARSFCAVDSILFREILAEALKEKNDYHLLTGALDLYREDFLISDRKETWIIRHRELLRDEFIKGAISLSEICLKAGMAEKSLPYLDRAIERDPLHEALYAHLMRTYLAMGYPANALKVFSRAKGALKSELDIEPGPTLTELARLASRK